MKRPRKMRGLAFVVGILIASAALGVGLLRSAEDRWWRTRLPPELGPVSTEYRKTVNYGFGPGGNSAGIVVYRLSAASADSLLDHGLEQLKNAPVPSASRSWRYWDWRPTPVALTKRWTQHGEHSCGKEPGIGAYIDYAALRCDVDPAVITRVNSILSRPRAYYAYGSASSVILVAPRERLVVLAFNG